MNLFGVIIFFYVLGCLIPCLKLLDIFKVDKKNKNKKNKELGSTFSGMEVFIYLFILSLILLFVVNSLGEYFQKNIITGMCQAWGETCNYTGEASLHAAAVFIVTIIVVLLYEYICQNLLVGLLPEKRVTFVVLSHMFFAFTCYISFFELVYFFGLFVSYRFNPFVMVLRVVMIILLLVGYSIIELILDHKYKEWN